MVETLYIAFSCAVLVWFKWRQAVQGRLYPFVGASCFYAIYLIGTNGVTIDSTFVALCCIAIWLLTSILWTESKYGILELFCWFSYLLLFNAARSVPFEIIAWMLAINGLILASGQLWLQQFKKFEPGKKDSSLLFPVFGNSNHNAAFYIASFFSALWLTLNVWVYLFPIAVIIGIAIVRTQVRGGIIGLVGGILTMLCMYESEMIIYSSVLVFVLILFNGKRFTSINQSALDRVDYMRDAIRKIHPKWLTGRGLNYFRLEEYGRIHNDHLEIIGELGFVGYFLFVMLFMQISFTPIIMAFFIAFMLHSLFFYPFREVHTAAPFWAIMGAASAGINSNILPLVVLKTVSALSMIFIFVFVLTVFINLINVKTIYIPLKKKVGTWQQHKP